VPPEDKPGVLDRLLTQSPAALITELEELRHERKRTEAIERVIELALENLLSNKGET
jgi:hypothetical protein